METDLEQIIGSRTEDNSKISKEQYRSLLSSEGYHFIEELKVAYDLDPTLNSSGKLSFKILYRFTKDLIKDDYVSSTLDKINRCISRLNEDYGYIHDVECSDILAEKINARKERNTISLKPGQNIQELLKEIEKNGHISSESEDNKENLDTKTKTIAKGKSIGIEAIKTGIFHMRDQLNKNIKTFINNYIKIAIRYYQQKRSCPEQKNFIINMQRKLSSINNNMKYVSHNNPYFKINESRYESKTHRDVNKKHFRRKVRPSETLFLERPKEIDNAG